VFRLSSYSYQLEWCGVAPQGQKCPGCKGNLTILRRILHLDLAKGNPKRTLWGSLARSVYKWYTEDYSTKPPIYGCPCDGGGCHSVTRTCPDASAACPVPFRSEWWRRMEVDDFQWVNIQKVVGLLGIEVVGPLGMEVVGPLGMGVVRPVSVRGHPSVSLLPLSSPTLHLFICICPLHLCTILKDHIHSRRLLATVRWLPRSRLINSRRLPAPSSVHTSTASDGLRTHWDRSTWCYGTLCHHMDSHIWEAWY
jgi:hypothetical protein